MHTIGERPGKASARGVREHTAVVTAFCRTTNSVVYVPGSGKIYASIPGVGTEGNSIARIDPTSGTIEQTTWIGSEPGKVALAVDGTTIYVGVDGALSIRRFNTLDDTAGDLFAGGLSPVYGPMRISDFALSPMDPTVVAVSRIDAGLSDSVAVFDNGVPRANVGGLGPALSFTNTESTLYGIDQVNFGRRMSLDSNGIGSVSMVPSPPRGTIVRSFGDRLYTSFGNVFRASDGSMIGTFPLGDHHTPNRPFVIDAARNTIFYVARVYYKLRIEAFDLQTMELLGFAEVENETASDPKSVARWGTNGLAISMVNAPTHFLQSDLIGPGGILPPATPSPSVTVSQRSANVRELNLPHNDLLFNEWDRKLYISVPTNAAPPLANTITRIEPERGTIFSSVPVGNDPHKMALSDDGGTLHVALHLDYSIRRFNTVTQTPGPMFEIPNRFQQPTGMVVLPGNSQSIAVAFNSAGLYIFDNGISRPQLVEGWMGEIVHNGTQNALYATSSTTPINLYKLAVSSTGVTVVNKLWQRETMRMLYKDGRIYSSGRRVIDPETNRIIGTFTGNGLNAVAVDTVTRRAFVAQSDRVDVFDIDTFNKIWTIALQYDENRRDPIKLVRWGYNGLAASVPRYPSGTSIMLIQGPLVAATRPFDFDADGKTDIGIFRPSTAEWSINRSSDGSTFAVEFGATTDTLAPADYTGDGKADVAVWRPSSSEWFVLRSEDSSLLSFPFGNKWRDVPVPADFDADGKADAAVFRPSNSTWHVRRSTDGGTTVEAFGAEGDVPVTADYDGDGKSDIAIYRPSLGQWWIKRSTAGVIAFTFGTSTDKPVQGDYTGDGKADVAFWRPSTGEWYILRSEDFSYYSQPFGTGGDIPAPGDYDGDGRFDPTVFRPSSATWFSQRSTAGTLIQQFGATGDRPIPNAFVP